MILVSTTKCVYKFITDKKKILIWGEGQNYDLNMLMELRKNFKKSGTKENQSASIQKFTVTKWKEVVLEVDDSNFV